MWNCDIDDLAVHFNYILPSGSFFFPLKLSFLMYRVEIIPNSDF